MDASRQKKRLEIPPCMTKPVCPSVRFACVIFVHFARIVAQSVQHDIPSSTLAQTTCSLVLALPQSATCLPEWPLASRLASEYVFHPLDLYHPVIPPPPRERKTTKKDDHRLTLPLQSPPAPNPPPPKPSNTSKAPSPHRTSPQTPWPNFTPGSPRPKHRRCTSPRRCACRRRTCPLAG